MKTLRVSQSVDHVELALAALCTASGAMIFFPAAGEALPEAQPVHSAVCKCSIPQRSPVRFRCV